eukprot:4301777-Prorocentrum_lima.AAC.1
MLAMAFWEYCGHWGRELRLHREAFRRSGQYMHDAPSPSGKTWARTTVAPVQKNLLSLATLVDTGHE